MIDAIFQQRNESEGSYEKPPLSVNTGTSTPLDCNEINYWDSLPHELEAKMKKFYYAQLKNLGSKHVKRTKTLSKDAKG